MSAKDRFHDAVKIALQKEGWTITDEPLQLPIERLTSMYIDFGAEKLITAERETGKSLLKSKAFLAHLPYPNSIPRSDNV